MEVGILVLSNQLKHYKKLNSYAEQQYNNPKFKNLDRIKEKIKKKEDLFGRGYNYKVLKIDETFPKFLLNNKNRFKDYIYTE